MPEIVKKLQQKDIYLTDNYLARTPFHQSFWVLTRIDKALKSQAVRTGGNLIDIGCGAKPHERLFTPYVDNYFGLEYSPDSGYRGNRADIAADAGNLPFDDESFETVLCTEVLEHIADPEKVIAEIARIVKPGGMVITTAPFVYPKHDKFDYFRYTSDGLAAMMKRNGLEIEEVRALSGTGLTLAVMINIYVFDIGFLWKKWLYPIGVVLRPVIWILILIINLIGWLMDYIIPSDHMAFNHLTVARKPHTDKENQTA